MGDEVDSKEFKDFKRVIRLSAKNSVDRLIEEIKDILDSLSSSDELMLISTRQIEAVKRALREIKSSFEPLKSGELEFFSYHINSAVEALSEITRPYRHQELLDKMFGEFCLGK